MALVLVYQSSKRRSAVETKHAARAVQSGVSVLNLAFQDATALVVCSTPATGLDEKGGYTFPVMEELKTLHATFPTQVFIAYDWAGSTNAWGNDKNLWKEMNPLFKAFNEGK